MTASTPYQLDNWRDPEILFGQEYDPFDLVRDLNGYATSDFGIVESDFTFFQPAATTESLEDVKEEDVKEHLYTSQTGIWENSQKLLPFCQIYTLNTISSELEQANSCVQEVIPTTQAAPQIVDGNRRMFKVRHISEDGPFIYVTERRYARILKQRKKRLAFLTLMPEYGLPYKQRSKDIKYKTRSKMAKDRKRNSLGKFSTLPEPQKLDLKSNESEAIRENKSKYKRHV
jgi:hypothetical protein